MVILVVNAAVINYTTAKMLTNPMNYNLFFKFYVVTSSQCWIWGDKCLQVSKPLPTSDEGVTKSSGKRLCDF